MILQTENLCGGYSKDIMILNGINFCLDKGEAVAVIGLNGCGKSTFGKALMNMLPSRNGKVLLAGQDVTNKETDELSRMGIAIMQQGGRVFPTLSVWDNIDIAMRGNDDGIMDALHGMIPLLDNTKRKLQSIRADRLSGGQRHQLALAMTLASHPAVVILDEPSAGLEPKAVEQMYQILSVAREAFSLSVVLIEQNIAKAVNFCDKTYLLSQGTIKETITDKDINRIKKLLFK